MILLKKYLLCHEIKLIHYITKNFLGHQINICCSTTVLLMSTNIDWALSMEGGRYNVEYAFYFLKSFQQSYEVNAIYFIGK